eukprot:1459006-Amphidinium_carterae.1
MQVLHDMRKNIKGGAQGDQAQQAKMIVKQLNQLDAEVELVDLLLERVASAMLADEPEVKDKSSRLKSSTSGSYVLGLATDPFSPGDDLEMTTSLLLNLDTISTEVKSEAPEKHQTLVKRTKDSSGCKTLPETCAMVKEYVDVTTNGFGETRVLVLKAGKAQTLDKCDTNANVALVVALDNAVTVTVGSATEQLEAQSALVVDHCMPSNIRAEEASSVLVVQ